MFAWLKNLFSNPKTILKTAVAALDLAITPLAKEIEEYKGKLTEMTSEAQAAWIIGKIKGFLNKQFKLEA